jgi:hypothetical protein
LQKPELISLVLENLERLYPVADAVASFFREFKNLGKEKYEEIGTALLRPLGKADETRPSEFYTIWILHIFAQHPGCSLVDPQRRVQTPLANTASFSESRG